MKNTKTTFSNAVWIVADKPSKKELAALKNFPSPIQQILCNRGIATEADAADFFNPTEELIHDPFLMADMDKAVAIIEAAIKEKERIAVHGDFDVDGVSSTAILTEYLIKERGAKVTPYIPHRVDEGYGLSKDSLDALAKKGAGVVITVDCGIKDLELAEYAKKIGIKLIITDHHMLEQKSGKLVVPKADAVIHPMHPKGKYPFHEIAGAAVAWKLVCALERDTARQFLDLVALATVCDVMPLKDENRAIVKLGLKQMNKRDRVGLNALIKQAGLAEKELEAYHLGFVLGPRINAAGRLESAITPLKLLIAQETYLAATIADKLEELNQKRQQLTELAFEEADVQAMKNAGAPLHFVGSENWREGVIGLVAGRLTEKYHRPAIAISISELEAKGSARSISGFNIVEALKMFDEYLERFGGHELAAGFTAKKDYVETLKEKLVSHAEKTLDTSMMKKTINIDARVDAEEINMELIDYLEKFSPTGYGNPTPLFLVENLKLIRSEPVGKEQNHLKLFLKDEKTNKTYDAIWFSPPKAAFSLKENDTIDIVCNIDKNEWRDNVSIQLRVKDALDQGKRTTV